jgi:hypothetical protein
MVSGLKNSRESEIISAAEKFRIACDIKQRNIEILVDSTVRRRIAWQLHQCHF